MTFDFYLSHQILAKLINQGDCCCSSRRLKNFENEKLFICMKIAEIDIGGGVNFGPRRTILGTKFTFLKLNPFSGGQIAKLDDLFPSVQREIL